MRHWGLSWKYVCIYLSRFFFFFWTKAREQIIITPSEGGQTKNIHLLPCLSGISCPATSSSCECLERKRASKNILSLQHSVVALWCLQLADMRPGVPDSRVTLIWEAMDMCAHASPQSLESSPIPFIPLGKKNSSSLWDNHEVSFTHLHTDESCLNYGIPQQMVPTHPQTFSLCVWTSVLSVELQTHVRNTAVSMTSCHYVKPVALGLEEALVCAEKWTSERGARCPAVLQEPAVPAPNQNHQPQPLWAGNALMLMSRMFSVLIPNDRCTIFHLRWMPACRSQKRSWRAALSSIWRRRNGPGT